MKVKKKVINTNFVSQSSNPHFEKGFNQHLILNNLCIKLCVTFHNLVGPSDGIQFPLSQQLQLRDILEKLDRFFQKISPVVWGWVKGSSWNWKNGLWNAGHGSVPFLPPSNHNQNNGSIFSFFVKLIFMEWNLHKKREWWEVSLSSFPGGTFSINTIHIQLPFTYSILHIFNLKQWDFGFFPSFSQILSSKKDLDSKVGKHGR